MSARLTVRASKRFLASYDRQSPLLRRQTLLTVDGLYERYTSNAPLANRQLRRVQGVEAPVWRVKVNDADRLLFHWEKKLTLLAVGDHDITGDYSDQQCVRDLRNATSADRLLSRAATERASRFVEERDEDIPIFSADENSREWLYYLDDEQDSVCSTLLGEALRTPKRSKASVHLLIGGPGTGKTSVLANLLDQLRFEEDLEVKLRVSEPIREFLAAHLPFDLKPFLYRSGDDGNGHPRVLLVDDPDNLDDVGRHSENAVLARHQMVIAAFDPLQLSASITDDEYRDFLKRYRATEHRLGACYRQRRNVGLAAHRIVAAVAKSTPFVDKYKIADHQKERRELTSLANDVEYRNPSGYVAKHPETDLRVVRSELNRIHSRDVWEHWPYLLVALDASVASRARRLLRSMPDAYYSGPLRDGLIREVDLSHVRSIKGTEFQHAIVFISRDLYHDVEEGFAGTGKKVYEARRLLRIPFSRARDSLVTFVM